MVGFGYEYPTNIKWEIILYLHQLSHILSASQTVNAKPAFSGSYFHVRLEKEVRESSAGCRSDRVWLWWYFYFQLSLTSDELTEKISAMCTPTSKVIRHWR